MKKIISLLLALLSVTALCAVPAQADEHIGLKYCVFWAYGTVGEYYLDPKRYGVGEIPPVPDVIPTKEDDTRLFHFLNWDRAPEPVKEDSFYYAIYQVYEKKYAMNTDTIVSIADVTILLDLLTGNDTKTLSNPDISRDGTTSIQDVTMLLDYLATANPYTVSAKTLLKEGK